jgi:arginyl-tRNA--protein-N-Asp/Glu arginylyltransferase
MGSPVLSFYPGPPSPIPVELTTIPPHECPYLPGKKATLRAFYAEKLAPELYHGFLDASFRRSGLVIYQPVCQGCRACTPLRVPVHSFRPSRSQRRCERRNSDLRVCISRPRPSDEKYDLYRRYQTQRHGAAQSEERGAFEHFLYRSPVDTVEFTYVDEAGRLLAVGICDLCPKSLSSVYFYFDPEEHRRGLGTYGALCEIEFARQHGIGHYYLGFWVRDCRKMRYKADFRPCEILHPDGCWREIGDWTTIADFRYCTDAVESQRTE